jgi:hypothetical protein
MEKFIVIPRMWGNFRVDLSSFNNPIALLIYLAIPAGNLIFLD